MFPRRSICVFHPIISSIGLHHLRDMQKAPPVKLLIVDDHAALRQTVRQMFEGLDVTILEASSGEEAVEVSAADHPDWIIMDMRMPGMGGIKATEAIRLLDAKARIIVMSQFSEPEYRDQARRAGALDFVNKEDMAHLVEIIRSQPPLQPWINFQDANHQITPSASVPADFQDVLLDGRRGHAAHIMQTEGRDPAAASDGLRGEGRRYLDRPRGIFGGVGQAFQILWIGQGGRRSETAGAR